MNQSVFVVGVKEKTDECLNCDGLFLVDGSGVKLPLPNPTRQKVNLGDIVEVDYNKDVIYRVKCEGVEWYDFGETANLHSVFAQVKLEKIKSLFKTKQDIDDHLYGLDKLFDTLPYEFQMRIRFWRDNIKDFRPLYEERELSIAMRCVKSIENGTQVNDMLRSDDKRISALLGAWTAKDDYTFLLSCDSVYAFELEGNAIGNHKAMLNEFIFKYNFDSRPFVAGLTVPNLLGGKKAEAAAVDAKKEYDYKHKKMAEYLKREARKLSYTFDYDNMGWNWDRKNDELN
jgi:hypothetical protein